MSLNEPEKPKKGWGCLQWSVLAVVLVLLLGSSISFGVSVISTPVDQSSGSSNARLIYSLLLTYAADNSERLPDANLKSDGLTANSVFRELFKKELIHEERIFSCEHSRFIPDRNIGKHPECKRALEPGENHWMMVAGLTTASPLHTPLLLENSVDASWPPRWHLAKPAFSYWLHHTFSLSSPPRGRSWQNNTILVSKMDGSVQAVKLVEKDGFLYLPDSITKPESKDPLPNIKLLDVEEKPTTTN